LSYSRRQAVANLSWNSGFERLARQKLTAIDQCDQRDCQNQIVYSDRRQWSREAFIHEVRKAADNHVLLIAGDGSCAAQIGSHSDSEKIRDRIALGRITRQIVSFTRKAESAPDTNTIEIGCLASFVSCCDNRLKTR